MQNQSEIDAVEKMLRSRPRALSTTERRAAYDAMADRYPIAGDVSAETVTLGGVAAEVTRTSAVRGADTILYLHGGGYVYGSIRSHRHLASELGRAAGARVFALDYRRAPEFPFPAALDDAFAAWSALLETGVEPARLALAGDSAGGGLAVALMVRLRDAGLPQPACALLMSPWVDMRAEGKSYEANGTRDAVVNREIIDFCAKQYLGSAFADHPLASPIRSKLRGLGPMTILVGATEALMDDSIQLARAAGLADVPVRLEIWPHMFHIWPTHHQVLRQGRQALDLAGAVLRNAFRGDF